jgi:hypothetical protein
MRRVNATSVMAAIVALVAVAGAGCSSSSSTASPATSPTSTPAKAIVWPAPSDPMGRARAAGLVPETSEHLTFHVHAHLDIFVDGQPVTVPAGLGIDTTNRGVHEFPDYPKGSGATGYGGIDPPCATVCISPLHTHDVTGIVHTESDTRKYNTLGQLFTEWNLKLDQSCVNTYCKPQTTIALYIGGKPYTGDPVTIPLSNFKEIAIVIGTPPAKIPATGDFSQI